MQINIPLVAITWVYPMNVNFGSTEMMSRKHLSGWKAAVDKIPVQEICRQEDSEGGTAASMKASRCPGGGSLETLMMGEQDKKLKDRKSFQHAYTVLFRPSLVTMQIQMLFFFSLNLVGEQIQILFFLVVHTLHENPYCKTDDTVPGPNTWFYVKSGRL